MNKTIYCAVIAMVAVLFGCGGSKQLTQVPSTNQAVPGFGQEVTLPCVDASYDDDENFRGLGTGNSTNIGNARVAALKSANGEVKLKLGGFVQGLSTDYSRTFAGDSGEKTQRAMEEELNKVVEKMLNDAAKICEKTTQDLRGAYNAFIVLEIPKKMMIDEMVNSLDENEELRIEYNRDQFRKFAEEKMKAMQKARNKR